MVTLGGLKWEVVYLSNDTAGNPVLTLWLSNSTQDAFVGRSVVEGESYGFYEGGLYSIWGRVSTSSFKAKFPGNMYGGSYIRAVTLNNGGEFAQYYESAATMNKSTASVFAPFTMEEFGLTQFLDTPSQIPWQIDQSAITTVGKTYTLANESLENPTNHKFYVNSNYGQVSDMFENDYYKVWGNDYLWLPSLAEVGYKDGTTYDGLWDISVKQRQSYDGVTNSIIGNGVGSVTQTSVSPYILLRSGFENYAGNVYFLRTTGTQVDYIAPHYLNAVRPALHLNLKTANENISIETWEDYASSSYASGSGTEASPHIIRTAEQLSLLAKNVNNGNMYSGIYFKQSANINLAAHEWVPIGVIGTNDGAFRGVYDGGNYTISNMIISKSDTNDIGLFGRTGSCTIKNIRLTNAVVKGNTYVGGIVGTGDSNSNIENCHVEGEITGYNRVGGIVGFTWNSNIENCTFKGVVTGNSEVGGIIGFQHGRSAVECYNFGEVNVSENYGGGIVGYFETGSGGEISFCHNRGHVSVNNGWNVGGIVGQAVNGTVVRNSTNTGNISGKGTVGGIVGQMGTSTLIENCASYCNITYGTGGNLGMIVGTFRGTIRNCSFIGNSSHLLTHTLYGEVYDDNAVIDSCYAVVNGNKYCSTGSFEGFGFVSGFNQNYPAQRSIYIMVSATPSLPSNWFTMKGFSIETL